jgi:C-terminal, D2-small domain, of ClpB protein
MNEYDRLHVCLLLRRGRDADPVTCRDDNDGADSSRKWIFAELELTDRAKVAVGKAGYDPVYGARPLKRALQRLVLDPLAIKVLKGDFKTGDTIRVDASASDDVLSFSRVNGSSGAEKAATLH